MVTRLSRLTTGILIVTCIGLVGCQTPGTSTYSTGAEPSPNATASATALPLSVPRPTDMPTNGECEEGYTCLGLLQPGKTYTTAAFEPTLTFSVPRGGWENLSDEVFVFQLLSIEAPGDAIAFFRGARAANPDGSSADVDNTVSGLSDWLVSNELLEVTSPKQTTVGGLAGVTMDIAIAADAANHPADCPVATCVPILKGSDSSALPPWRWDWGSGDGELQRLYLLEASDGVLAIFVDSYDGTTFVELASAADEILAGLTFDVGR